MAARDAHHYEVAGRVLLAFFTSGAPGIFEGANEVRFWEAAQGGLCVDWERGPHVEEVVEHLRTLAADEDLSSALRPGDVVPDRITTGTGAGAVLFVQGLRLYLRPHDTIGAEAARLEALAAARSTLS